MLLTDFEETKETLPSFQQGRKNQVPQVKYLNDNNLEFPNDSTGENILN